MSSTRVGHLWAVGYADMERASQVKDEVVRLGWDEHYLDLSDIAVVVRHPDGSFTLNREPFPTVANILGSTVVGLLTGLALAAQPLTGVAAGAVFGAAAAGATASAVGISDDFVREIETMMTPGTSALFVLDYEGDMEVILKNIRGLGGTVLKTNVDVERAKLIQSTLAGTPKR